MYPFKATFPKPAEHTPGVNTCQYIILHHTGTKEGTIKGVLDGLYKRNDYASCHFVVDTNGDVYKIGDPKDILWHAGESKWGKLKDMNKYSVGIEIIGPLSDGGFTGEQKLAVRRLVQHLMAVLNIPFTNVLRHADLTWSGSENSMLWDWKSKSRKVDIASTFFFPWYTWFKQFRETLVPKEQK